MTKPTLILKFIPIFIFVLFEIKMAQHIMNGVDCCCSWQFLCICVDFLKQDFFSFSAQAQITAKNLRFWGAAPGVLLLYSTKWQNNFSPEVHSTPIWQSYIYLLTTFETAFFAQITCKIIGMKGRHLS